MHRAVDYRPLVRHDVSGGYTATSLPLEVLPVKWVTGARPKPDRIACPWLIRRFIDPDAEIPASHDAAVDVTLWWVSPGLADTQAAGELCCAAAELGSVAG